MAMYCLCVSVTACIDFIAVITDINNYADSLIDFDNTVNNVKVYG